MNCLLCGAGGPVYAVTFRQNIGLLVMRMRSKVPGNLCRPCITKTFWRMTLTTLFWGWWGLISFFATLAILPMNVAQVFRTRKSARPVVDAWERSASTPHSPSLS